MFQISISEFSTYRWSFFQDILQATKRGFDGVGVWRKKAEEADVDEAIDFLHEMEMPVSSVSWAGGFTGGDGRSHVAAIDDAKDAIDFARQVQANCLIVHPGSLNNHTNRHATRLVATALDELVPFAVDNGVRLALEPRFGASAASWTFFRHFQQTLDLIRDYDPNHVGLVLDLYHVGQRNEIYNQLGGLRDRIALVQVADRQREPWAEDNRLCPGRGELPLGSWLNRLAEIGYRGFLELEIHGFEVEATPYNRLVELAFGELCQLVKQRTSQPPSAVVNSLRQAD